MPISRSIFLLAGIVLLAIGMWVKPLAWVALGPRIVDLMALTAASAILSLISARLFGLRLFEACLVFGVGFCAIYWAGFAAIAATGFVLLAGLALGSLLGDLGSETTLIRWVAGLGILAAGVGWTLPFPIHFAPTWIILLSALVWWRRDSIRDSLRDLQLELRGAIDSAPLLAFACSLILILASAPAWLPVVMPDDLHYHLTLLYELREFGHSRFDVGTQVWALAPWSTDVLHALVSLISNREAHGVLNVAWLVAATLLVRSLGAQMGLSSRFSWLAAMLYARHFSGAWAHRAPPARHGFAAAHA